MQPEDDQPPRFVSRTTPIIKGEDDAPPRFVSQPFESAPTPMSSPPVQTIQSLVPSVPGVTLSEEQQTIVDLIAQGKNVFYTGSAGCGKSTVLKAAVARLRTIGKRVKIVAPTGRAALDVGGITTWTFAGWKPDDMKKSIEELERLARGRYTKGNLHSTDVLVIDEISMVEAHFFERLNSIMKVARENDQPFGNVQLVVTGDFCQLPPVRPFRCCFHCGKEMREILASTQYRCTTHGIFYDRDKWTFRSKAWFEAEFVCKHLEKIHRQSDKQLIGMLQKIRLGYPLTHVEHTLLLNHPCDVTDAVKLFSTREQVRLINKAEFLKLKTQKFTYHCLDAFKHNPDHVDLYWKRKMSDDGHTLLANKDHTFEEILELKVGALVVLLINLNIEQGLVNGSQGRVIGFKPHDDAELPKPANKYDASSTAMDDRQERIAT